MAVSSRPKKGRAVGKTKRGKGTKPMQAADGNLLPIGFELASANHHEVKLAVGTLEAVRVPRRGRGVPKQRPEVVVADKAYDSRRFWEWLHSKGIRPTIPSYQRREEATQAGSSGESRSGYAERWKVERTFAWLVNFRRLLVRHERYLSAFRAFFLVAFILRSLRRLLKKERSYNPIVTLWQQVESSGGED